MKINKWTLALASVGLISLPGIVQAEEKQNNLLTSLSSTTISGYVDTAAQWNFNTGEANLPKYTYGGAGKADGFNLNKVKLTIEKPLDESQWAAGYRTDLLFGPDANVFATTSSGTASSTSDFAIQQAYVALRAPVGNGLDFKMGVFDSVIGYESHDSVNNPNYTRSYGVGIEPHTHTGLLASYQVSQAFSMSAGVANTFGPTINARAHPTGSAATGGPQAESYKTYMGSIALTAPEKWGWIGGSGLYAGVVNGFNQGAANRTNFNQTSLYVGTTVATPVKGLKFGASYDYAAVGNQPDTAQTATYQNATALHASFAIPDSKVTLHARGEYFTQSHGLAGAGLPLKVVAMTGTLQYDLWKNVMSRLEFRWDHQADGLGNAYGRSVTPTATNPYGGTLRNVYLLALNVVYKF